MEFLDTNVLVYAVSRHRADAEKNRVARELVQSGGHAISLQVLGEFYAAATHPRKLALSHDEAVIFCNGWKRFTVLEPTLSMFEEALSVCSRFQIGYYDAAIIAAARKLGCTIIHSEDLNDGQNYGGVRVMNPFKGL